MESEWNDRQPIYRQLRDRVIAMILDGALKEGDPLPSVRTVATASRVNPLTVLKAYQELADEQLVETRRGLGMFVNAGARNLLLKVERQKFLTEEWPRIATTIERLGITPKELWRRRNGERPAGSQRSDAGARNAMSAEHSTLNPEIPAMACIEARGLRKVYGSTDRPRRHRFARQGRPHSRPDRALTGPGKRPRSMRSSVLSRY